MTMEDATQIANEIKHVEGNVDSVEKKVKKVILSLCIT